MDNNFSLELAWVPKELRLLLEILKEDDGSIQLIRKELCKNLDWEIFLHLASHHRVDALIYSKIKNIDGKLIPSHVKQTLYQIYIKNTFQMLQLSGEMEKVSKLFIENQIPILFLKGPVIAADLYGDISLRTSKDLDILIPIKDLVRAEELLITSGYEREVEAPEFFDWKWRTYHVKYFHHQKRIQLEIHWRLHPSPMKQPCFNTLWKRKRESTLTSYPVYFLGKEDLFLYLVAHGARHGWFRLRWLIDIDRMVRKGNYLDGDSLLIKGFQKQHLGRQAQLLVGQAIFLASEILNTPIKDVNHTFKIKNRSRRLAKMGIIYINEKGLLTPKYKNNSYLFSLKSNLTKSFMFNGYLFSLMSTPSKFLFIIRLFYPSSLDADVLILPKPLHFLYFPLRPFLWFWRKTRKTK